MIRECNTICKLYFTMTQYFGKQVIFKDWKILGLFLYIQCIWKPQRCLETEFLSDFIFSNTIINKLKSHALSEMSLLRYEDKNKIYINGDMLVNLLFKQIRWPPGGWRQRLLVQRLLDQRHFPHSVMGTHHCIYLTDNIPLCISCTRILSSDQYNMLTDWRTRLMKYMLFCNRLFHFLP